MLPRSPVLAVLSASMLLIPACQSGPKAPCKDTQAVVEATAAKHPDVQRLTVHRVPPGGGEVCAVASTSEDKLGKPSDREDKEAMETGKVVVLDEQGAVDVTVPVLETNGKWMAAVGVTWKPGIAGTKESLTMRARDIASEVANAMPK